MHDNPILRISTKILFAPIILFGLYVQFHGVKFALRGVRSEALFDELLLALYTPSGIRIYRHNHKLGVSTAGRRTATAGHEIKICGPKNESNWQVALDAILAKLDAGHCQPVGMIVW